MKECIHTTSKRDNLIERYLLCSLSPEEELSFIDHLMECDMCSARLADIRKLTLELQPDTRSVAKKIPMHPLRKVLYAVAAAVVVTFIAGGAFLSLHRNHIPKLPVDVAGVDTMKTNDAKPDSTINLIKPTNKPPQESIAHDEQIQHQGKPEETDVQMLDPQKITPTPGYASKDSLDKGEYVPMPVFEITSPALKQMIGVDDDKALKVKFAWRANQKQPVVILIMNPERVILDRVVVGDADKIIVDMGKFTEYDEIEWVLMWGSADNRCEGKVIFRK